MKIAHLVIGGDVAGGQMMALELARAARARGDDAVFLSPTLGPFTELAEREGMGVRRIDAAHAFRLDSAVRLARLLRRERIDLLHTHAAIAGNVLGRIAARLARVPVVSHLHIENHLPSGRLRAAALRTLDNATARLAARIVVVSDDTRRALLEQGYPDQLMEVVPNGTHLVSYSDNGVGRAALAELGVPDGVPVVGEVARLCDVKGQHDLIAALTCLPDVRAVFVGDDLETGGAYRDRLEREAEALGVRDRIVFAGYRPSAPILAELDLFVLPSWIEGMPVTVLEAMAHGKPVVATPVGGTAEVVVDGETGLLVPPRDPERLAEAIARVLADREYARQLGEAGRARVAERFSADAMARRVLEIYDEVVVC